MKTSPRKAQNDEKDNYDNAPEGGTNDKNGEVSNDDDEKYDEKSDIGLTGKKDNFMDEDNSVTQIEHM